MPRTARDFSKNGPAIEPDAPDTGAAAQQRIVLTPAGAAPPLGKAPGPASVFALAGKPERAAPVTTLDIMAVQIHTDRPLPPARGSGKPLYGQLWDRIPVGGCVELPDRQANGLASYAKKVSGSIAIRRLTPTTKGVWRTA